MVLFYVVRYNDGNLAVFIDQPCRCGSNKRFSKCCYEKEMWIKINHKKLSNEHQMH